MKTLFRLVIASAAVHFVQADVVLAPLFQDGAVLQQGKPVPVWGTARPGESVEVQFQGQRKNAVAGTTGQWKIVLDPLPASDTPSEMRVAADNNLKIADILVGEVWICSGQSNMAWTVKGSKDFPQESANANLPLIRQFKVELSAAEAPQETVRGGWTACSPSTVGGFTAVGYFFGRDLHKALGVPVGLINTSYGGTAIESWMSDDALRSDPAFAPVFERWKQFLAGYPNRERLYQEQMKKWQADRQTAAAEGRTFTQRSPKQPDGPVSRLTPSGLFNAMVHPLTPYAIRGIIWYQGETNAPRFAEYAALFTGMIDQWRRSFDQGNVPFYFVQLANLERSSDPTAVQWAFQREAQAAALKLPGTGMAVAADIGEADNIHPKNKQEVGRRLALIALALAYEKNGEYSGPVFVSATPEGRSIRVRFAHAKGLRLLEGASNGFEIAGADKIFHPATVAIEGESLLAASAAVDQPVAIRYAWRNNPAISLYNAKDLPAPPFRTDDWPAPLAPAPGIIQESSPR